MSMIQTATATALSARSAEAALVAAIHGAADALDGIGRDPLVESLSRLTEAAANAQARLRAGRLRAASLLLEAIGGFEEFEADLAPAPEPVVVAELPAPAPAPVVEPAPEPEATAAPAPEAPLALVADEVVTATAANGPVSFPVATLMHCFQCHREFQTVDGSPDRCTTCCTPGGSPLLSEGPAPVKGRGRGRKAK